MIFKRKIYSKLLEWKKCNGKTALLIEGARRVGKSTIVEEFAKNEYKSYILINFATARKSIKDLFFEYGDQLDDFFFFLSSQLNVKLYERDSLIIFDEVQNFPKARELIKYFVLDGRYDFIETGSLLSIKTNIENITLPSEERKIKMYPMDFEEFLWALKREDLTKAMRKSFDELKPLRGLHNTIMTYFRKYMFIGGMPQALNEYLETKDYTKVDEIKRDILNLYRDDITKFANINNVSKVKIIFDNIISQLNRHEKKFNLASISKDARYRDYEDAFMWLSDAMIVNICFNSSDPNIGLFMNRDRNTLKLYMSDTGLLLTQIYSDNTHMYKKLAEAILMDKLNLNNGMIFENIVAQMLTASGKKLFFYSNLDRENSKNTMEIDFLIPDKSKIKISPIEVKSGKYYTTASLDKFSLKYKNRLGRKYLIHVKDLKINNDIVYLPVYLTLYL